MKRVIGFALFFVAFGMLAAMFMSNDFFIVFFILLCLFAGYLLFCC